MAAYSKSDLAELAERAESGDQTAMAAMVQLAESGNEEVTRWLFQLGSRLLYKSGSLPPPLRSYFAGGMYRYSDGATFKRAFAPSGRQNHEVKNARRAMDDSVLVSSVGDAISEGLATSKDGEPGPAFEHVAEAFGLPPSTVRNRYYRVKKSR